MNIALATDENYLFPTCIAMESVLINSSKDIDYEFYVLMDEKAEKRGKSCFGKIEKRYHNCKIHVLRITEKFDECAVHIDHISAPTYFRLLLPELIEADRCIYLDSDIIVCQDIAELDRIDLQGHLLAGVYAPSYHQFPDNGSEYIRQIEIPAMDQYINAGVLVMNLQEMRNEDFTKTTILLANSRFFPCQDQDIINRVAYGKIKILDFKYNFQPIRLTPNLEKLETIFTREELGQAINSPIIIHYSASQKPWEYWNLNYAEYWWHVCRQSLFYDEILDCYQTVSYYYENTIRQRLWMVEKYSAEWIAELKKWPSVFVYGAGKKAAQIIGALKKYEVVVEGIYVSDRRNNPIEILGIPVTEFSSPIDKSILILFAVAPNYQASIRRKLFANQIYNVMDVYDCWLCEYLCR